MNIITPVVNMFAGPPVSIEQRNKVGWTFIACRTRYDEMLLDTRADITWPSFDPIPKYQVTAFRNREILLEH